MRLHLGAPLPTPNFSPQEEGWTPLREPSPLIMQLVATPVGLLAAYLVALGWNASNVSTSFKLHVSTPWVPVFFVIGLTLAFFALIAVHELIHALGCPRFGFDNSTVILFWPSKLLFGAMTFHALPRNRQLLVFVLPLLVITILPLIICRLIGIAPFWLMAASVVNALAAGGDIFCFFLILAQVPRNAEMRNQGWASWWRMID